MKASEEWVYLKALSHENSRLENHLAKFIDKKLESGELKTKKGMPLGNCVCPACIMDSVIDLNKGDYLYHEVKKKYRKNFSFAKMVFEQAFFVVHMVRHHKSVKKAMRKDFEEIRLNCATVISCVENCKVLPDMLVNLAWNSAAKVAWRWNKSWTCDHECVEDKK